MSSLVVVREEYRSDNLYRILWFNYSGGGWVDRFHVEHYPIFRILPKEHLHLRVKLRVCARLARCFQGGFGTVFAGPR